MTHVGGQLQSQFMARVRGRDPGRCLVVPVDVGKSTACALVANHYVEMIIQPFDFALTETGYGLLSSAIGRAQGLREAEVVRVGVESAGHYHRTLVSRLQAGGYEVVELSPRAADRLCGRDLLPSRLPGSPTAGARCKPG